MSVIYLSEYLEEFDRKAHEDDDAYAVYVDWDRAHTGCTAMPKGEFMFGQCPTEAREDEVSPLVSNY